MKTPKIHLSVAAQGGTLHKLLGLVISTREPGSGDEVGDRTEGVPSTEQQEIGDDLRCSNRIRERLQRQVQGASSPGRVHAPEPRARSLRAASSTDSQHSSPQQLVNHDQIVTWKENNRELSTNLGLSTSGGAASHVKRFARHGKRGDGQALWLALIDKYEPASQPRINHGLNLLGDFKMRSGEDPDIYISRVEDVTDKLRAAGEVVSEAKERHHLLKGFASVYDSVKVRVREKRDYPLAKIKQTMRNIYAEDLGSQPTRAASRKGSVRDFGMSASSTSSTAAGKKDSKPRCFSCGLRGHLKAVCERKSKVE